MIWNTADFSIPALELRQDEKEKKMDKKTIETAINTVQQKLCDRNGRVIIAKGSDPYVNARIVRALVRKIHHEKGNGNASLILAVFQAGEFILFKDEFYFVAAGVAATQRMYKMSSLSLLRDEMEGTFTFKINGEEILA